MTNPDIEWQDINDLRTQFYGESESRDTTRKGSKLLYEYIESGWVHPPEESSEPKKSAVSMNKDGLLTAEREFTNLDETVLNDPDSLMVAHGYDPEKFKLVSSKNSAWTVGNKAHISSKIVVEPRQKYTPDKSDIEEWFKELAKNYAPKPLSTSYPTSNNKQILVIPFSDLHFGLQSTMLRTKDNYDLEAAENAVLHTLTDIFSELKNQTFERIVFTIGGDMINADNITGTTTRGTPQDNCTDYFSTCKALYELTIMAVDILLNHAPVHVIYVPANHDKTTSYQLAQYVKAWYRNNQNVTVDDSPFPRKYFQYGDTLMMFAHDGDIKRLPQLIADEARNIWSSITFTDVFLQHLHSEQVLMEENHMRIQRLPTLSARSAWIVDQGYNAARQHKSFIYDEHGLKSVLYSKI